MKHVESLLDAGFVGDANYTLVLNKLEVWPLIFLRKPMSRDDFQDW